MKPFVYGQKSLTQIKTLDHRLQLICYELIKIYDVSVLEGHRGEAAQMEAFRKGASKLKWPHSKHNALPSMAMDIAPSPVKWTGTEWRERFCVMAGMIFTIAHNNNIKIRWGLDWDQDWDTLENVFDDICHFEIIE